MMNILVFLYFGLAYWLYRYFVKRDRGSKESGNALRLACIMGLVGAFFAGSINSALLPETLLNYLNDSSITPPDKDILQGSLIIGVVEETLKFLPLALIIYKKKFFNETTDGIIYFGLCGMWFGTLESLIYAATFGEQVGFLRLLVAPFLHAGFSAIAGWGLANHKVRKTSIAVPIFWLLIAILAHGLYDFGIFTKNPLLALNSLIIAVTVNVGLFRLFKHARRQDERLGLSAMAEHDKWKI